MKYAYLLLFISFIGNAQSGDIYYHEISSILIADARPNILNVGVNYEGGVQFQAAYTINKYFFTFITYNFQKGNTESESLFGDRITNENNNYGFSSGAGIQNLGRIGNYRNLECLIGYEFQQAEVVTYFSDNQDDKLSDLSQKYFKIFSQFNILKVKPNYDLGFSLKVSYFRFIENPVYAGANNVFIAPSFSFNYKFLKNKSLMLTSQICISAPMESFEYSTHTDHSSSHQSVYIVDGNLKLGVQYKLDVKKLFKKQDVLNP